MATADLGNHALSKGGSMMGTMIVATGTSFANYMAAMLCYPLDTINTWIKLSNRGQRTNTIVRDHIRKDGFRVLFKGGSTTFLQCYVPTFIYFFLYENLNRYGKNFLDQMGWQKYSILMPGITAGISEALSLLISVPIDTVRTRMQMNSPQYQYRTLRQGLSQVIRNEGYIRLFKASPLYLFNSIMQSMIFFQTYEYLRVKMKQRNQTVTFADSIWNTVIATGVTCIITNPLDLLIIRYQTTDSNVNKLCIKSIAGDLFKRDGLHGLNRGLSVGMLYGILSACTYIPIYEELRKRYGYDFAENN